MLQDYKKYFLSVIMLSFLYSICPAQQQKGINRIQFHSINQLGLLNGETGSSCQIQTINGIQYKSWFAGIGVGLDYYRFRGIPLFADIRKTFGAAKNKLFVYGDGGIHFSWVTDKEKTVNGRPQSKFSNGLYLDGGIGYQIQLSPKNALLLSVGYSYKQMKETAPVYYFYPMIVGGDYPQSQPTNSYNYHLNRISIKVGWEF